MMRAMMLEFPHDPGCDTLDRQYMLGDALLVAPVFREDNVAEYYVPEGEWTKYFTGETVVGPRWVRETHAFTSVPLLVRPGTLLAQGHVDTRPDYDYGDQPVLTLYALPDGQSASAVLPTQAGETDFTVTVHREGDVLHVSQSGHFRPFDLRVAGTDARVSVTQPQLTLTPYC